MRNPLLDLEFLRRLDLVKNKATYAKIILLTWSEEPVYEIQGKITAGSVNIDGNSAIRRTCSLTMVSPDVDITNTYWALKNKFKLEVGIENTIEPAYPEIIWFKQGIYIFTNLNMNVQSNNFTISLNGKDKMCLLNGEVGGSLNASIDFGKLEEYETLENGEIIRTLTDIPVIDIIKNAVHTYANEPLDNIILNDIDNYGLELLEYRGDNNLYMPRRVASGEVSNIVLNKKQVYYLKNGAAVYVDNTQNHKSRNSEIIYYDRTGLNSNIATKVWATKDEPKKDETAYNIIKVEYGETVGYRRTDLTYPGDLIGNVGENLVSILDKIKNMFGDFEYFYDIDGRFVFQKKKTYVNTSFNNLNESDDGIYADNAAYTSSSIYSFENGVLLSAFTNAPQILNIRNDYSIWGKRKGTGEAEVPVHLRYAIDFKPTYYKPLRFNYEKVYFDGQEIPENSEKKEFVTYQTNKYYTYSDVLQKYVLSNSSQYDKQKQYYIENDIQNLDIEPFTTEHYDWREIIYQMALDYFKYSHKKSNFNQLIAAANPEYYPTGITGYESYYTDLQGFWRQLYHPGAAPINSKYDSYYDLFTYQELYEAAREIILEERDLIYGEDLAQLIIDYLYENFDIVRANFIKKYASDETTETLFAKIEKAFEKGFSESSKVIQGLLAERWEKMDLVDGLDPQYGEDGRGISDQTGEKKPYFKLMKEEKERDGNKTPEYRALRACSNYAARKLKTVADSVTPERLFSQLVAEIEKFYNNIENPNEIGDELNDQISIQNLLFLRWELLVKNKGQDNTDYLSLMEDEYLKNGESYLYQAYLMSYDYMNQHKQDYYNYTDDEEKNKIMYRDAKGVICLDSYLSLLFTLREKKIRNYGYDSTFISNENFLRILLSIIETFDFTKEDFQEKVIEAIQQQLYKNAYDFSQEIIDYIYNHYESRNDFFIVNEKTNKIYVENSHIQYLLDMRDEKIKESGDDGFYLSNDLFVAAILETIENYDEVEDFDDFKQAIEKTMENVYSPLNRLAYDFSLEIIDYISNNYDKWNGKLFDTSDNTIKIKNKYLQYLFLMRQEKINILYDEDFYPSNSVLATLLAEAIQEVYVETTDEAEQKAQIKAFKNKVSYLIDELHSQFEDSGSYDFSLAIIEHIANNYELEQEEENIVDKFFIIQDDNKKIRIKDSYLQHLFDLRQEKIGNMNDSFIWIRNSDLIILLINIMNDENITSGIEFKDKAKEELAVINGEKDKENSGSDS